MAQDQTLANWRNVLNVNLTSAFLGAKYQLPALQQRGGGSLIFTSSFVGYTVGMPGMSAYAASKAGLIGLTRDLAQQWSPRKGIRVNALAPGYFASEMTDDLGEEYLEQVVIPRTLLGRLGTHQELGAALLFLASDAGGYLTGLTLPVEGGVLAT